MKLEYANLICPKCGNGNYMRHLVGKNVGELNVKCINCNSYFKLSEFYRMTGKAEPKQLTNYERLVSKTPEELAEWLEGSTSICFQPSKDCRKDEPCTTCLLKWLKSPAERDGES